MEIEIDPDKKITQNAAKYYEESKKYKKKIKGAKEAIKETKKLLRKEKKRDSNKKEELKKIKGCDEWYDKFHWCKTSNNCLVIAGRNAEQNQELVKNYMEEQDLYFHAKIQGAPSVILKEGKEASKKDKEEAAVFAGSYSSAWKQGVGTAEVYHVKPNQVKLGAESGEYMGTGAFRIKGEKSFHRSTELEIAFTILQDQIRVGPPTAIKQQTDKYVLLRPGDTEKNKASKKIKRKLIELFNVKIDLNWILKKMPPDGCRVVN